MTTKKEFGNIRGTMFPIHKSELRKFLPMAFMFILISFCYSLTRSLKDMNMMKEANTTAIYWLKAVAITPSMIFLLFFMEQLAVLQEGMVGLMQL